MPSIRKSSVRKDTRLKVHNTFGEKINTNYTFNKKLYPERDNMKYLIKYTFNLIAIHLYAKYCIYSIKWFKNVVLRLKNMDCEVPEFLRGLSFNLSFQLTINNK